MSLKHGGKGPLFFSRKVILLLLLLLKIISTNGGQGNYYSFFLKENVTSNYYRSRLRDIHFLNLGRIVTWCSQWTMIHFMSIDRS